MPGWWDYPRAPVAGVRKAPRHEIAGCGRQQCRGCYGELAAVRDLSVCWPRRHAQLWRYGTSVANWGKQVSLPHAATRNYLDFLLAASQLVPRDRIIYCEPAWGASQCLAACRQRLRQGWGDQAGDRFRGDHLPSVRMRHRAILSRIQPSRVERTGRAGSLSLSFCRWRASRPE